MKANRAHCCALTLGAALAVSGTVIAVDRLHPLGMVLTTLAIVPVGIAITDMYVRPLMRLLEQHDVHAATAAARIEEVADDQHEIADSHVKGLRLVAQFVDVPSGPSRIRKAN